MNSGHWKIYFGLTLSLAGYLLFGYFLQRENFYQVASVYLILFASYLFLIRRSDEINFKLLIGAAVLFRLSFLFSIPSLSDDYFRFIWDGKMSNMGVNPYSQIPSFFILFSDHPDEYLMHLLAGMNSQDYYSVYPPVMQFIFAFAAWLFPQNLLGAIIVLRIVCIAAEIGTLILLKKLLEHFQLPKTNLLWYALNPLAIVELSGNIHFEAVMIFFLLLAIRLLVIAIPPFRREKQSPSIKEKESEDIVSFSDKQIGGLAMTPRLLLSAIIYSFSIATKLIPLLFLPFLIRRLGWKRSLIFFLISGITVTILFAPFISRELIENIGASIDLYFQKFEFNASIYYVIRWIGFQVKGYNIIQSVGQWLAFTVFLSVIILMLREKKLTERNFFFMMQWSLTIYLLLSTTVHPWYLTTLVMMSVFTEMRFAIVWSLVVVLSYATYQTQPYHENLWLTTVEYLFMLGTLILELINREPTKVLAEQFGH